MKNNRLFLFIILPVVLLGSCRQNEKPGRTDSIFLMDTVAKKTPDAPPTDEDGLSGTRIDTIFELAAQNKIYQLVFTHQYHSLENPLDISTTVRMVEKGKEDTLLTQTFDYSQVAQLRNPAPGCYWLSLENSGGGSGYSAELFNVRIKPFVSLQSILKFDELSYWKSNRAGNELVFFEGYWNMANSFDSRNFEAHFEAHKQSVSVYQIDADTVRAISLGMSKHKYDFFEEADALEKFKAGEPDIAEKISWEQYGLETDQGDK